MTEKTISKTKAKAKKTIEVSDERKLADFDTRLKAEIDYLGENKSYLIFRKIENEHNPRVKRVANSKKAKDVLLLVQEKPLVVFLEDASTTQGLVAKYESKGWPLVHSHITKATHAKGDKDSRIRDVITHASNIGKLYSKVTKSAIDKKIETA